MAALSRCRAKKLEIPELSSFPTRTLYSLELDPRSRQKFASLDCLGQTQVRGGYRQKYVSSSFASGYLERKPFPGSENWGVAQLTREAERRNLVKSDKPAAGWEQRKLDWVRETIVQDYRAAGIKPCRPITLEESYEKQPKDTSPGFPGTSLGFQRKDAYWISRKTLFVAEQRVKRDWVATVALKEEMRPIEKVEAGKTRVIYPCDAELNWRLGKYIIPVLEQFIAIWGESTSVLGVNMWYGGWNWLDRQLHPPSHDFSINIDVGGLDKSVTWRVYHAIASVVEVFLDLTDEEREDYWECIRGSYFGWILTNKGYLIRSLGLLSGLINTSLFGTMASEFYIRTCVMDCFSPHCGTSQDWWAYRYQWWDFVKDHSVWRILGDDNHFSCDYELGQYVTVSRLGEIAKTYGFEYEFSSPHWELPRQSAFLGVWTVRMGNVYVPMFDATKLAASLVLKNRRSLNEFESAKRLLERALAFRILTFSHPRWWWFDAFVWELVERYKEYSTNVSWQKLVRSIHTHQQLVYFYTGLEASGGSREPFLLVGNVFKEIADLRNT